MGYNVTYKESVEKDLRGSDKKKLKKIFAAIKKDIVAALHRKGEAFHCGSQVYWKHTILPCSIVYEIFERDEMIRIDRISHRNEDDR